MNSQQKVKVKGGVLLLLLLSLGLNSCKKSNSSGATDQQGPAKVIVNMLGVDENSKPLATNSAGGGKQALNAEGIQEKIVPFNNDISIVATLVPLGSMQATAPKTNNALSTNAIQPVLKPATAKQNELLPGVKYRVVVYDAAGAYVTSNDYAYGNETSVGGFTLDAKKQYTFVAYSVNSTTATLPDVVPTVSTDPTPPPLSGSNVKSVSGDLMYFSKQVVLNAGDNNLDIVLKHKHSQVTTNISLDANMLGTISAISGVVFQSSTRLSANMNLSNGALTYPMGSSPNEVASFTGMPGRTISSTPTLVITSGPTVTLSIGSITVGGVEKLGTTITGLSILPGQKYALNITIHRNCNATVYLTNTTEFSLMGSTGTSISQTNTYPYDPNKYPISRVVFYISQLDESFSMTINGFQLISNSAGDHEFRFNPGTGTSAPNVELNNGTRFGVSPVPTIQASSTTAAFQLDLILGSSPSLQLTTSLGQARFITTGVGSGYAVNPAAISSWNLTGSNTVTVTQKVIGTTIFKAKAAVVTLPCAAP